MKVLVAPNSMKGSLSASEFAGAIAEGLFSAGIVEVIKLPVADGGDGTAEVLSACYNADFISCTVNDPLGREIQSGYYLDDNSTAVIEMADASGLKLLKPREYSAMNASSFGVGQLIKHAVNNGALTILLGVGGSATVDGGMGALMALGFRFLGPHGEITEGNGKNMGNVIFIDRSDADRLLANVSIKVLTDVDNPLLGENGAVSVFAPQKGASEKELTVLEKNMSLFAGALFQTTGHDVSLAKGGGAAGGIAASLLSLLNAEIIEGAPFILAACGFRELAAGADVIITGEGAIDSTTFDGKITGAIAKIGMEIDKPVYAVCGINNLDGNHGFEAVITLAGRDEPVEYCMLNARDLARLKAKEIGKLLLEKYG